MNCFFLISDESPPPIGSRFFRVLLLTGFSIFLCTVSIVPRLEAAPLDSERSMLARGQYKEAIEPLQKEIAGDSGNAKALALLIQARAATGDYRKGFEEGEAFLKRTSDPDVAESTAGAALEIGEYERAAALVEKDSSPRGIWTKGLVAEHKGDQEAAGSAFRQLAGILSQGRRLSAEDRALAAAAL